MIKLTDVIRDCVSSRQHKGRFRCGSDWCPACSLRKTMRLQDHVDSMLQAVKQPYFATILIGPVSSYATGIKHAKTAVKQLARIGVTGVGAFELANKHDTDEGNWSNFMTYSGFDPSSDIGIAHLHVIMTESNEEALRLSFPLNQQVLITPIGVGDKRSKVSMSDNVHNCVRYIRKRQCITVSDWINEVDGGQLVFGVKDGVVSVMGQTRWCLAGDRWGDAFERLQTGWIDGVGGVKEDGKLLKCNGRSVGYDITDAKGYHTSIAQQCLAVIAKLKQRNVNSVSPSTDTIAKDMTTTPIQSDDTGFAWPVKSKTVKPKKQPKLTIKGLIEDHNRYNFVMSGKHKGHTVDDMFQDKQYVNYLRKASPYALQALVRNSQEYYPIAD